MISEKSKMKTKIIFLILFAILGLIFLQIPINFLAGSKVKFTLFDLFAPVSGAFVGTGLGLFAVLGAQIANILTHGSVVDKGVIIRLFPTLFAVWFFAKKDSRQLLIPAIAIISFNLNPVGRSVWFYSLFWLVPYIVWPLRERFLIARSLGATMTAHAVGGAVWVWVFNLPASVWISLIPVVIVERFIFALGISAHYILFNNIGAYLTEKKLIPSGFIVNKKYLISDK